MYFGLDAIEHLPAHVLNTLGTFVSDAARPEPGPADWRRFYEFTRVCAVHDLSLTKEALGQFLELNGFSAAVAGELSAAYLHGRAVLAAHAASFTPAGPTDMVLLQNDAAALEAPNVVRKSGRKRAAS
jgi:hypothetical protein